MAAPPAPEPDPRLAAVSAALAWALAVMSARYGEIRDGDGAPTVGPFGAPSASSIVAKPGNQVRVLASAATAASASAPGPRSRSAGGRYSL